MRTRSFIALLLYIATTVGIFFLCYAQQQQIDYQACAQCDGNQYASILNYFNSETDAYQVNFPFHTRVLVPYLVSLAEFEQPETGFHFVNLSFAVLSVLVLYLLWSKLEISPFLRFIGFAWLLLHWSGMIRLNIFDPMTVDVPLYLFHGLLLLIVFTKSYRWLPLLAIVATAQKESFPAYLLIAMIFVIVYNRFYEKHFPVRYFVLAVAAGFLTKFALTYFFPASEPGHSSFISVLYYTKEAFNQPETVVRWLVAIFTAYGSLLFASWKSADTNPPSPEQLLLVVLTMLSLLLGIIAGGDHTRIVFLGFPFVMTWVLLRLQHKPVLLTLLAVGISLPLMHLFDSIPTPQYVPFVHAWYPEFAAASTVALLGLYMIISGYVITRLEKWIG